MNNYEIVFEKLTDILDEEKVAGAAEATTRELDEIEELRRFSAELREPEPVSLTTTA